VVKFLEQNIKFEIVDFKPKEENKSQEIKVLYISKET